MRRAQLRHVTGLAVVALALCASALTIGQEQNHAADAARLIEVLDLKTGDTAADIGAGGGLLSVPIAKHLGPSGRLYATDINPQRIQDLHKVSTAAGLSNVIVVEGSSTRTNLPDACCDAVFMRHVYHHIGDVGLMNASLLRTVKPGGRIAVVDFAPNAGVSAPAGRRDDGDRHGVMAQTVIEELSAAGFIAVEQVPWSSPGYFSVVARRPVVRGEANRLFGSRERTTPR